MTPLQAAFHDQAEACRALGSPFMHRLCSILEDEWPADSRLAEECARISDNPGSAGDSLPLRIASGLHALRLLGDPELAALYPPRNPDEQALRTGISTARRRHEAFLLDWVQSPPQTNEIRRSAALIPAARVAVARFGLPIQLSELGASGGLNLMWDHFALTANGWRVGPDDAVLTLAPDWHGPPPPEESPIVAERRGVDLRPLDPKAPGDLLRLYAFLWPDQPERLAMTRAAAGAVPAPVDRGDAMDWLATRLSTAPEGYLHLIQNTIAWQYFPQKTQARGKALIEQAGAQATETRPLAWLQLESDGDKSGVGGAAITLQMWPGDEVRLLGRADFHGRWVLWHG